jgi:hypothetical protein
VIRRKHTILQIDGALFKEVFKRLGIDCHWWILLIALKNPRASRTRRICLPSARQSDSLEGVCCVEIFSEHDCSPKLRKLQNVI